MQIKGLKNNKKKICMFLDFGFEALKKEKKKICNAKSGSRIN